MPPNSGSSIPAASPKGTDMSDYPLASHGTPIGDDNEILMGLDPDVVEIDLSTYDANQNEKGEYRKDFPFSFDLTMTQAWDEEVARVQDHLRKNGIHDAVIDEVALLVPDANSAGVYIFDAVLKDGVEHFNASEDRVSTRPFNNEYRVRYDFLRIEGRQYRLEVMHLTDGISPIHAALYQQSWTNNEPVTVHVSFKCPSEASYRMACGLLRDQMAMVEAQSCEADYGVFSYWRSDITDLYVKPRFNRRSA